MKAWRWLAPAVIVLLAVTAWPIGRGVWLSLHTYSLTNPGARRFIGVNNYLDVLTSRTWWLAVALSLLIVLVVVSMQLMLGFAFAVALRRMTVLWPVSRIFLLVPFAVLAVVSAVMWRDAVTTGYLDSWFRLGGEDGIGQLGSLLAVTLGEVWRGTGIVSVILLAGLSRVSPSLLASSIADGATGWQRFRRVTLPVMGPAFAVAATYRALDTLRILEGPLLVDRAGSSLRTAPLLIWRTTFSSFELGLGAAMSVVLLLIAGVLGVVVMQVFRIRRVI